MIRNTPKSALEAEILSGSNSCAVTGECSYRGQPKGYACGSELICLRDLEQRTGRSYTRGPYADMEPGTAARVVIRRPKRQRPSVMREAS